MDKDKREGWIRELKVGDKVCIDCGSYGHRNYSFRKIDKITPTGRMVIGSETFDSNGWEMGKNDKWSRQDRIIQYTEEIKEFLIRRKTIGELKDIIWDSIETSRLLKILASLKEKIKNR